VLKRLAASAAASCSDVVATDDAAGVALRVAMRVE